MKRALLFLTLALTGCASDTQNVAFNPVAAQTQPQPVARELYAGSLNQGGQTYALDLEFSRDGSAAQGFGRVILDDRTIATGPLQGTDSNGQHNLTLDLSPGFPVLTLRGSSSAGLQGSYSSQGDQTVLATGAYQAARVAAAPSVGGRYSVTLDTGAVMQLNLAPAPTNDPNLPDVDTINGVNCYWGSANSMAVQDAGGGNYYSGNLALRVNVFDSGSYPFLSCFLNGSLTQGRYVYIGVTDGRVKSGSYSMKQGF